jgi:spore coat polysaccharide biosynthesis protein SpsF
MKRTVRVLAILQARMSSSRLPGKVLMDVLGQPMLARQIERIHRASHVDALCVATSIDASDDPIDELCRRMAVAVSRGSLDDVLDRYYRAALPYAPDHIVRLTGDCPLIDPAVIDQAIAMHLGGGFDYTSNTLEPTYPDGLDVEVCSFHSLQIAWREARLASQREHVTPFIKLQPQQFRIGQLRYHRDLSGLRWTVDYQRDMDMVRRVYELLSPSQPTFLMEDILDLLQRHPELRDINTGVQRDEGYLKSIANDRVT